MRLNAYLEMLTSEPKKILNVGAAIITKEIDGIKSVLLIQRDKDDHWPLFWEFPRGKCDKGKNENIILCTKREVKEETGLDIKIIALVDKFEYLRDEGRVKSIQHNFLAKMINENQEVKLSNEHQNFKWVSQVGMIELLLFKEMKRSVEKVLDKNEEFLIQPGSELNLKSIEQIEETSKNIKVKIPK